MYLSLVCQYRIYFIFTCLNAIFSPGFSQSSSPENKCTYPHSLTFLTGAGTALRSEEQYSPILFLIQVDDQITRSHQASWVFSFLAAPQFNLVLTDESLSYEAGLNLGAKLEWKCSPGVSAILTGSTGPHYMSAELSRQANGFTFCHHASGGISFKPASQSRVRVTVQSGIRHVSNADLKLPNDGINNILLLVGLSYSWGGKTNAAVIQQVLHKDQMLLHL